MANNFRFFNEIFLFFLLSIHWSIGYRFVTAAVVSSVQHNAQDTRRHLSSLSQTVLNEIKNLVWIVIKNQDSNTCQQVVVKMVVKFYISMISGNKEVIIINNHKSY